MTTLLPLSVLLLMGLPPGAQGVQAHSSPGGMMTASGHSTIVIHNAPRTAVVGRTERFWALLSGQPHRRLIYVLHYPDGHAERIPVRTDSLGYASHTFRVRPYAARRFRETATLSIEDTNGRVLAFTRFAIQAAGLHAQAHGHSHSDAPGHQHPASTDAHQHGAGHAQVTQTSTVNTDLAMMAIGLAITAIVLTRPSRPSCTSDATGRFSLVIACIAACT